MSRTENYLNSCLQSISLQKFAEHLAHWVIIVMLSSIFITERRVTLNFVVPAGDVSVGGHNLRLMWIEQREPETRSLRGKMKPYLEKI